MCQSVEYQILKYIAKASYPEVTSTARLEFVSELRSFVEAAYNINYLSSDEFWFLVSICNNIIKIYNLNL